MGPTVWEEDGPIPMVNKSSVPTYAMAAPLDKITSYAFDSEFIFALIKGCPRFHPGENRNRVQAIFL
jgi:hypothetical protein